MRRIHLSKAVMPTILLLLLGGCASSQTTASIEVVDGCLIRITGINATTANDIVKTWDFDPDCRVEVMTDTNE
jgi:hypothetical protein